ncbi:sulfatase-like hydrolase/transferase [Pelagicoccus mobilis]|uniref:Sulfatase-like hydrolase/transferase n=2 Tax=Pelagicoccus mobilis TaxID=415221 RepID=A0A934RUW1_9BACT|nr:sulfatase-like hydrolase/transferase [Pelagicoccus mobilis]
MFAEANPSRPNILIIMSDDSGYADLGCYGGEIDTPNIDSLASSGLRLTNFYTNGRCSPTRASLLSGLYGARVGFGGGSLGDWWRQYDSPAHRGRLPYDTPLLPELLNTAGYQTMMSGKWHLGGSLIKLQPELATEWKTHHPGWTFDDAEVEAEFNALPPQRGFDQFFGMHGAQGDFFITPNDPHEYYEGNQLAQLPFNRTYSMHCYYPHENHYAYTPNHGKTSQAFYDTDGITDRAIEMLNSASDNQSNPFFAYVAYRAPHTPLQAPEELVQKYLPRYQDLDQFQTDRYNNLVDKNLIQDKGYQKTNLASYQTPEQVEAFKLRMAVHAAMMEKVNQNVGRILDALDQKGLRENTLILYFSDNGAASHVGAMMNKPYNGSKALVWEGGTKTHFIANWPGHVPENETSHSMVWVGDLLPTLLNLAGVGYPQTFRGKATQKLDGRDVSKVLDGEEIPPPETLFFNDKGQQSVIYQGRWKLLIEPGWYLQTSAKEGIAYELYDLHADPTETNNLAKQKPELVQTLARMCENWIQETGIVDYAKIVEVMPNDPF